MKLVSLLSPETIEHSLGGKDRRGVLAELAELLRRAGQVPSDVDLLSILEEREALGSTGIGRGVAIPHVRVGGISSPRLAVGRSAEGIEFGAPDGQPVNLFFLLITPEDSTGEHLRALARISRLLKNAEVRRALLEAGGSREMLRIIEQEDEKE